MGQVTIYLDNEIENKMKTAAKTIARYELEVGIAARIRADLESKGTPIVP